MKKKILIVDDWMANRQILKNILYKDYEIFEAASGDEALFVLANEREAICAVLLDIVMPKMDGYELLKKIRANDATEPVPVIMTTGNEDEKARNKCLSLGANDFVMKPYNPDVVRHCVRNNVALYEITAAVKALKRDKLTGLCAREAFFEQVQELTGAHEAGYYIMACFNADGFRVINDQYGTQKGDEALRHIASTFKSGFEARGGVCSRVFTDNFAVLFPAYLMDSRELEDIRARAGDIYGLVSPLTFSVGWYVVDDKAITPDEMYQRAMLAMDSIKGKQAGQTACYDEALRRRLLMEQEIVNEMEGALKNGEFETWFQPQYDRATDAVTGAEALVRWRHPQKGLISPGVFIPIFERNGFVYELDKFVWEDTCRYLRRRLDAGHSPLPISVNISGFDIFRPDFVSVLTELVKRYAIPVELLRLEITESAFFEAAQRIVDVVTKLIELGFTVEIDDFGSGYSSLSTLRDSPAQIIKIDMKFLETGDSARGGSIVESIIRMATRLGMSVIAEGVETPEQADYLSSVGCSCIQGYLYATPMPAENYENSDAL